MRLDARSGAGHDWYIWDCELVAKPKYVVWVDDVTAQYGRYVKGEREVKGGIPIETIQAHRIDILVNKKLIFINPIEDNKDAGALAVCLRFHKHLVAHPPKTDRTAVQETKCLLP